MSKRQAVHLVLNGKYERTVFIEFGAASVVGLARKYPAHTFYRATTMSGEEVWHVFLYHNIPHWNSHVPDLPKELEMMRLMGSLPCES